MNEKINVQELVALLAQKSGITKKEAESFLKECFDTMNDALLSEQTVKVKNLGTFKISLVNDRESVDVATGERVLIPAHYKVTFSAENSLAQAINEPFSYFEPVELSDDTSDMGETIVFDEDEDLQDDEEMSSFELIMEEDDDTQQDNVLEIVTEEEAAEEEIPKTKPKTDEDFELIVEDNEPELTIEPELNLIDDETEKPLLRKNDIIRESTIELVQANITQEPEHIDNNSKKYINKNVDHLENRVYHPADENLDSIENFGINIRRIQDTLKSLNSLENDDDEDDYNIILEKSNNHTQDNPKPETESSNGIDLQKSISKKIMIEDDGEEEELDIPADGGDESAFVDVPDYNLAVDTFDTNPLDIDDDISVNSNTPIDIVDNTTDENIIKEPYEDESDEEFVKKYFGAGTIEIEKKPSKGKTKKGESNNETIHGKPFTSSFEKSTRSKHDGVLRKLSPVIYVFVFVTIIGFFYFLYNRDLGGGPAPIINDMTIQKKYGDPYNSGVINPNHSEEIQEEINKEDSLIDQALSIVEKMGMVDSTTSASSTVAAENKPNENKPVDNKVAENKPAETKPAEAKPAQTTLPSNKPVDTQPKSNNGKKITIQNGKTLARLALEEYGNRCFWVYIYEENKSIIKNPDSVPAGLTITIPSAEKYQIDKDNPESVKRANDIAKRM